MKDWRDYLESQTSDTSLRVDIARAILTDCETFTDAKDALENANGIGAYLPLPNLIYYSDIYKALSKYGQDIDDFLHSYKDEYGYPFRADGLSEIVWATVEHACHSLLCDLLDCEDEED